jgi:hypothetical protein
MAITMYTASVPTFLQHLGGLKGIIEKVEAHATAGKIDPAVLLNWRLAADMFPFARQVRQASEHALGAGRAAGIEVPKLPDIDTSFAEMHSRIDQTIAFLKTIKPEQLDGKEDKEISVVVGGNPRPFKAQNYLFHFAMPNFFFHLTTAYNIVRGVGVAIGKRDFMGQPPA